MSAMQERKCTSCGMIKSITSFRKNRTGRDGRTSICRVCLGRKRVGTFGLSFEDASCKAPLPASWIKGGWKADIAWHVAREKQQDLMRRDVPYYPSNTVIFAPTFVRSRTIC